jgi:Domain of unknown function (DUF4278)
MRLIYRGLTFNFNPMPTVMAAITAPGAITRTLIYRGFTYLFTPAAPRPTRLPRAINWRYRVPCEVPQGQLTPAH